jgi:hypothetical protein
MDGKVTLYKISWRLRLIDLMDYGHWKHKFIVPEGTRAINIPCVKCGQSLRSLTTIKKDDS